MTSKKKYQILVVDDSITNVVLLNALLTEEGYKIHTAFNVPDALKLINKDMPDLVLLDLNIPEISGFDFLKAIKAEKKTEQLPVIVVTAYNDFENAKLSKELGADDFIEKPVNVNLLMNKIKNTLIHQNHAGN